MADKHVVQVPGLKALGPYSQAVRLGGLLFVWGQPGVNPSTAEVAGATFERRRGRRSEIWTPSSGQAGADSAWSSIRPC